MGAWFAGMSKSKFRPIHVKNLDLEFSEETRKHFEELEAKQIERREDVEKLNNGDMLLLDFVEKWFPNHVNTILASRSTSLHKSNQSR